MGTRPPRPLPWNDKEIIGCCVFSADIETFLKRFHELPLIPKGKLTKEHKCCVGLESLSEEQKSQLAPLYTQ